MPPARGSGHPRPSHVYNPYSSHPHQHSPRSHPSPLQLPTPYHLAPIVPAHYANSSFPSEPSSATSIHFTFPVSDEETKPIIPAYHPPGTGMHHSEFAGSSLAAEGLDDLSPRPLSAEASGSGSASRGRGSKKAIHPSQRQQFTACGACRLRRVRCDLKDVAMSRPANSTEPLQCTNCKQRELNCVDEYAKKPVKMLRRGRRLQQAQAMYGIGSSSQGSSPTLASFSQRGSQSIIPMLQPSFFQSEFFRHFYFQRPIVDSAEFDSFCEPGGMGLLNEVGDLVAKCLVIWAASYGVDPAGRVYSPTRHDLEQRRNKCQPMVQEVLDEVDRRGVLRKLSWDNVRLVCLLLPLTLDTLEAHERNAMYRSALSQAYELAKPGVDPVRVDRAMELTAFLKLRILWYALVFEGVKTALYGNPLLLDEEVWRGCIPGSIAPRFENGPSSLQSSPNTVPTRTRHGGRNQSAQGSNSVITRTAYVPADDLAALWVYALPPVDASLACRRIHAELTCDRAVSRPAVDARAIEKIWEMLERCWEEFDSLKSVRPNVSGAPGGTGFAASMNILPDEERAMLASRWQIFLVECHVVILDALKTRLMKLSEAKPAAAISSDSPLVSPIEPTPPQSEFINVQNLVAVAKQHCTRAAQRALAMLPWMLGTSLFQHDSTLVCRGVYLAGRFVVEEHLASDGDIKLCLQALDRMHWAFGDSVELDGQLRDLIHLEAGRLQHPQPMHPPMQSSAGPLGEVWDNYSPETAHPGFPSTSTYTSTGDDYQFPGNLSTAGLPPTYGPYNQIPELSSHSGNVGMYAAPPHDPTQSSGGAIYAQDQLAGSDPGYGEQVTNGSGQPTPDSINDASQPFAFSIGGVGPAASSTSPSTVHNSRPTSSHQAFHNYGPHMDSYALNTPTGPVFPPFASPNSIGQGSAMQFVAQEFASADAFQNPVTLEHPSPHKLDNYEIHLQQYPFAQSPYHTSPFQQY